MYYVKDRNIDVNLLRVRETGYRFLLYSIIIHQYIVHPSIHLQWHPYSDTRSQKGTITMHNLPMLC